MSEQERRVPGESLVERMERRTRRRPRLGMSPAFYARLGLDDPWASEGAAAGPDAQGDGMVFVSAAPYYAMLQKLAAARRRRERRMQRFLDRRAGTALRAASRAWPGEAAVAGRLPLPKVAALSVSDMRLPAASSPASPPTVEPVAATEGRSERAGWGRPARVAPQAWLDSPYAPARVAHTPGSRPMERVGERLRSARRAEARAAVEATLPVAAARRVAKASRALEVEEAAPVELSGAQAVRVVRRAKVARPVVRIVEEEIAPPTSARPVQIASTRMADGASRGLRPLALRSPAMAVATADLSHAADVDRATALALAAPERGESMRPAAARRVPLSQRASARGQAGRPAGKSEAPLSASPVSSSRTSSARPVAASPVVRASARDGGAGGERTPTTIPTRPSRLVASARAVARLSHAQPVTAALEPDSPAPLAAREARPPLRAPASAGGRAEFSPPALLPAGPAPVGGRDVPAPLAVARAVAPAATLAARRFDGAEPTSSLVPRPVAHARRGTVVAAPAPEGEALPSAAPVVGHGERFVPARLARAMRIAAAAPTALPLLPAAAAPPVGGPGAGPSTDGAAPARASRSAAVRGATVTPVPSTAVVSRAPADDALPQPRADRAAREAQQLEAPVRRSRRAVAPAPGAAERRAATSLTPGTSWAAARAAAAGQPESRSILPRPVAPALRLARGEAPAAEAAPTPTSGSSRPGPTTLSPVARRAEVNPVSELPAVGSQPSHAAGRAAVPGGAGSRATPSPSMTPLRARDEVAPGEVAPTVPSRTAPPARPAPVAATRPAPVAAAARRADTVARDAARQAVQVADGGPSPSPRGQVRRSGPLSWAQPRGDSPLVASFVAPAPATPRAARPARAAGERGPGRTTPEAVLPIGSPATRPIVEELAARGLVSTHYSPSTPVRTPDGRYVSARVAQAMPNLAVVPALAGPVAVSAAPVARAPGFRTPEVRFVGAPSATTPDGVAAPARSARTRPTEWVAARTSVTAATAYRGAIAVGTDEATFRPARTVGTPTTAFVGATSTTTPAGEFTGARASSGPAAGPAIRRPRAAATAALPSLAAPAEAVERAPAPAPSRRRRPALESTVLDVATDAPVQPGAPNWAARADGRPLVRSAQGLFDSLARATSAEQVVAVIAQRAGGFAGAVPITEPMREVVEAIRQEIAAPAEVAEPVVLSTRAPEVEAPRTTVLRGTRVEPVRSSARTSRGSVRPVRSAAVVRGPGGADDRISKLVKRLTDLIHLAEDQRRLSDAQSQVRMAEDTAAARAEGSAPMGQSAAGGLKLDIETFTREVLEVVNRELELRRERRMEDGDESGWW